MRSLLGIFGRSPFGQLVEHARKVHECVSMVRPVAEAVVACDTERIDALQHDMSKTEYEADLLKDSVRQRLPRRYFLSVSRGDIARYLHAMDKIADEAEDFAVAATLRSINLPPDLHSDFLALVDKVLQVSESLLAVAEHLAELQQEAFVGPDAQDVLEKIQMVCHMEWESDKLSRNFAKRFYGCDDLEPVAVLILEKLCQSLARIADHAENVGKTLRLMIARK